MHEPTDRRTAQQVMDEMEAAKIACGETFVDQLRLAFAAEPFVPFTMYLATGLKFTWVAGDEDIPTVKFLDDALTWEHGQGRIVVRYDQIAWLQFSPVDGDGA
jgi:hypothetical protein